MPLRHYDPFASRAERLDATVNPYVALLTKGAREGQLPLAYGEGLRGAAGGWRERLRAAAGMASAPRLVCEIGCHKGFTLLQMAREHPDVGFLGIDITYKRVVMTAQRARQAGLANVFCVLANAAALDRLFAPGELDGVIMFFPDPWSKKPKQTKHRLVDAAFTGKLAVALGINGFFWYKTDCRPYFDQTAELLGAAGFARQEDSIGPLGRDYDSAFERRFHSLGVATSAGVWRRPN